MMLALATLLTLSNPRPLPHRIAVLVGANQPGPGRRALQHAHHDAELMAEVLAAVGRFPADHIHVLRDPAPDDVLALLRTSAAELRHPDSLLYFYYSGHADEQSLYPAGKPLPLAALRAALDATGASVRLGLVDACRGGAWTRTKGLVPDAPFEVPVNLGNEGSVLIASSSGLESAHESDALQGSFFTHHFVAGLRGAADKSENGEVTLSEAFEYAKERTVRDTAQVAREPQHPSYAVNLRGRQDLVLSQLATSSSALLLAQDTGPLDLIQLDTGLTVLELAPGSRRVRLALRPGRYLVRRTSPNGNSTREVAIVAGGEVTIAEGDLVLRGAPPLAAKGAADRSLLLTGTTLPRRTMALSLGFGLEVGWSHANFLDPLPEPSPDTKVNLALQGSWLWALTDRLTWALPALAFAYRFGERGGWEVVPDGGVFGFGYSSVEGFILQPGAHLGVRRWLAPDLALAASAGGYTQLTGLGGRQPWSFSGTLGISHTVADAVTFNLSVGVYTNFLFMRGELERDTGVSFGSVQNLALRPLPLLEWHLGHGFALDLQAQVANSLSRTRWSYSSVVGLSYVF
jgi:hypothetical protein